MESKIFFAFLFALFFLALFVLTGYASNIFLVSKQVASTSTKSIGCSDFEIGVKPYLSRYNYNTDVLTLLVYNSGVGNIHSLTVLFPNRVQTFAINLSPGSFERLVIPKFSVYNTNRLEVCPENCSVGCYVLDLKKVPGYS